MAATSTFAGLLHKKTTQIICSISGCLMLKEHEQQLIEGLAETRRLADSLGAGQVDALTVTRAIKDVEVQLQHLALHLTESAPESCEHRVVSIIQ